MKRWGMKRWRRRVEVLFARDLSKACSGYLPDEPNEQDLLKSVTKEADITEFSLFNHLPPVMQQGRIGACTGYAAACMMYNVLHRRSAKYAFLPSPLYIYAQGRVRGGWPAADKGAYLRDTMKVLHKDGLLPSELWERKKWADIPDSTALFQASMYKIKGYERILVGDDAPETMASVLQHEKLPLVIGVKVFTDWHTNSVRASGAIPMPKGAPAGGHAMCLYGYDATKEVFYGQNSWGRGWGNNGRFTIPFGYFRHFDFCHDIWSLTPDYD